jgi:hypothetical protein
MEAKIIYEAMLKKFGNNFVSIKDIYNLFNANKRELQCQIRAQLNRGVKNGKCYINRYFTRDNKNKGVYRANTKKEQIIYFMSLNGKMTLEEIYEATGFLKETVRGTIYTDLKTFKKIGIGLYGLNVNSSVTLNEISKKFNISERVKQIKSYNLKEQFYCIINLVGPLSKPVGFSRNSDNERITVAINTIYKDNCMLGYDKSKEYFKENDCLIYSCKVNGGNEVEKMVRNSLKENDFRQMQGSDFFNIPGDRLTKKSIFEKYIQKKVENYALCS